MLEAGIVKLVMADDAVKAICAAGGFLATLPKDTVLPSWTYRAISDHSAYCLQGEHGFVTRRLQIDCFGAAREDAMLLGKAINKVLSGYRGTLADSDSTIILILSRGTPQQRWSHLRGEDTIRRRLHYRARVSTPTRQRFVISGGLRPLGDCTTQDSREHGPNVIEWER